MGPNTAKKTAALYCSCFAAILAFGSEDQPPNIEVENIRNSVVVIEAPCHHGPEGRKEHRDAALDGHDGDASVSPPSNVRPWSSRMRHMSGLLRGLVGLAPSDGH